MKLRQWKLESGLNGKTNMDRKEFKNFLLEGEKEL